MNNNIGKIAEIQLYSFFNFLFWGYCFGASYFFCKDKYNYFSNEFSYYENFN